MSQLEKIRERIKAHTITYETLDAASEAAAGEACDAWGDLAEAYADEAKELARIDIEGDDS